MQTWQLIAAGLASCVLAWAAVRLSIEVAKRTGALDSPDGDRKVQATAIPRLGGVAVAVAFAVAAIFGLVALGLSRQSMLAVAIVVPALLASLVGLADDYRNLSPRIRLVLQAGVGAMAYGLGTRADLSTNSVIDLGLTIFWVMLIVNGLNLLDNSDGLAASTALVSGLSSLVIAVHLGQTLIALLAMSLVGVSAGFLLMNWFPARVYLGDSGAYFLGTLLALLIIRLRPVDLPMSQAVVVAFLLATLPIVDTTYVIISRLRRGVHPFTAGRDHLSHRLQKMGLSVPTSVVVLQGASIAANGLAVAIVLLA